MINYIKGNILDVTEGIIAHGVNARGAFGSGVAGQIRKKYPDVYKHYIAKYKYNGWNLGDIGFVKVSKNLTICNCCTQLNYGTYKVQVDYDAIKQVFVKLIDLCEQYKLILSMPKIGAGLAGGDWKIIECVILDILKERDVTVNVYTLT